MTTTMTDRLTLLSKIYVPRSMGADDLLEHLDHNWDALDPDDILGVRYLGGRVDAGQYYPILAEETVANLMPVSADIMREVVADKLWCEWRLERDGFKLKLMMHVRYYERNGIWFNIDKCIVNVRSMPMHGVHTYTDLITLVRLAEG